MRQADIAQLTPHYYRVFRPPRDGIRGWINEPRAKTESPRRVPLWPETADAMAHFLETELTIEEFFFSSAQKSYHELSQFSVQRYVLIPFYRNTISEWPSQKSSENLGFLLSYAIPRVFSRDFFTTHDYYSTPVLAICGPPPLPRGPPPPAPHPDTPPPAPRAPRFSREEVRAALPDGGPLPFGFLVALPSSYWPVAISNTRSSNAPNDAATLE